MHVYTPYINYNVKSIIHRIDVCIIHNTFLTKTVSVWKQIGFKNGFIYIIYHLFFSGFATKLKIFFSSVFSIGTLFFQKV